jgi:hypothetical protein
MERRRESREKRRLTCEVRHGDERLRGVILDVSARGLFVQTTSPIPPGNAVVVEIPARGDLAAFAVQARVARRRRVPPRLAGLVPAGLGLEIVGPLEAWASFVERDVAGGPAAGGDETPPPPRARRFRVRAGQPGSPRSRTLPVEARDEEHARERVRRELVGGWEIVEVEEIADP